MKTSEKAKAYPNIKSLTQVAEMTNLTTETLRELDKNVKTEIRLEAIFIGCNEILGRK